MKLKKDNDEKNIFNYYYSKGDLSKFLEGIKENIQKSICQLKG